MEAYHSDKLVINCPGKLAQIIMFAQIIQRVEKVKLCAFTELLSTIPEYVGLDWIILVI